jgi:hypothetical protein
VQAFPQYRGRHRSYLIGYWVGVLAGVHQVGMVEPEVSIAECGESAIRGVVVRFVSNPSRCPL